MSIRKLIWLGLAPIGAVLLALNPAGFELLLIVDAIGLETFGIVLEAQILAIFAIYMSKIKSVLNAINARLSKNDSLYFIPSWESIKSYPPIVVHAVPGAIALPLLIALIVSRSPVFA